MHYTTHDIALEYPKERKAIGVPIIYFKEIFQKGGDDPNCMQHYLLTRWESIDLNFIF